MKKKYMFAGIAFVLGIIVLFSILRPILQKRYDEKMENLIGAPEYKGLVSGLQMEGVCNQLVTVFFSEEFFLCEYEEQVAIIGEIATYISDAYNGVKNYIGGGKLESKITFHIADGEDAYVWDFEDDRVLKSDFVYTLEQSLRDKIAVRIVPTFYEKDCLDYITEVATLERILALDDDANCRAELIYCVAMQKYKLGSDKEAMTLLRRIRDYKDSGVVLLELENKHRVDGTWWGSIYLSGITTYSHMWIIDGNDCYNIYSNQSAKNDHTKYYCVFEDNRLYLFYGESMANDLSSAWRVMEYKDGNLIYTTKILSDNHQMILEKQSDATTLPETTKIKDPAIGMTAEEVRNSTWGEPREINRDTYSWGVFEQWVYGVGRYIYLEDGIVTSISD